VSEVAAIEPSRASGRWADGDRNVELPNAEYLHTHEYIILYYMYYIYYYIYIYIHAKVVPGEWQMGWHHGTDNYDGGSVFVCVCVCTMRAHVDHRTHKARMMKGHTHAHRCRSR
jgi:hypothetical protein